MKRFLLSALLIAALAPRAGAVLISNATLAPALGDGNALVSDQYGNLSLSTYNFLAPQLVYGNRPYLGSWTFEPVDSSADVGRNSSIAVNNADGSVHISYFDATNGALKYAVKSGGNWTYETVDDGSPIPSLARGEKSSIALDSAGNPHIAYLGDPSENTIFIATKLNGVWSFDQLGTGGAESLALKIDRYGRLHLAWLDLGNGAAASVMYAVQNAGNWSEEPAETFPGGVTGASVSLALDPSGNPRISYGFGDTDLRYAERNSLGWTVTPLFSPGEQVEGTSLVLAPDGAPRIAVSRRVNGVQDIQLYWRNNLGAWAMSTVDTGERMVYPAVTQEPAGYLDVAYFGLASGALKGAVITLPHLLEAAPNVVRPNQGPYDVTIYGDNVSQGNLGVQLVGPSVLDPQAYGAVLDGPITATFDFTNAEVGAYDLFYTSSAGNDTLLGAVVVSADGPDLARLTDRSSSDGFAAVRPGGPPSDLLFESNRDGLQDLFIKPATPYDVGNAYRVTTSGSAQYPSWSPHATQFVYADAASNLLYVQDPSLSFSLQLNTGGTATRPAWSPVGDLIAYDNTSNLFTIEPGTDVVTQLTAGPIGVFAVAPSFSPDGSRLVFVFNNSSVLGSGLATIAADGSDAGIPTMILPEDGHLNFQPQWSPDGRWIAFTSDRSGNNDIWAIRSDGSGSPIQITTDQGSDSDPKWLPDGSGLIFTSDRSGGGDVYRATNLPLPGDVDGDGIPDNVDACPTTAPALGEIDRDGDGCPDPTSSFRFTRFWAADQLPLTFETDPVGDPAVTDGSDFAALDAAFATWTSVPGITLAGGDDGLHAGPSDAVSGDRRNTITFSDPDGFNFGTLAFTAITVAADDTVIGGREFRPGEIVDADILFNTANYDFGTPGSPGPSGSYDIQTLATHEMGHMFGFGHSSLSQSTMFYVVYRGTGQRTLKEDDVELALRGYSATPLPLIAEGMVVRPDLESAVVGAGVYLIDAATSDTLQMTITGVDGVYRFYGTPPATFKIWVHPLDGSAEVNGLKAKAVTALLDGVADTDFEPEFWDEAAENDHDGGSAGFVASGASIPYLNAWIITNPDLTGPSVLAINPPDGSIDVPATSAITVSFDQEIDIDSVPGNLSLVDQVTGLPVAGNAGFLTPSNVLVFTPTVPLLYSHPYRFTLGPGITDTNANPIVNPQSADFTIQAQPPVAILAAAPSEVPEGGTLVLSGTGFDPVVTNDLVTFTGGATAVPFAATLTELYLTVPAGAQTGTLLATVNAVNSNAFPISILPPKAPPSGAFLGEAMLGGDPRKVTAVPGGVRAYVATGVGVTEVDTDPATGTFLNTVEIPVPGGAVDVAATPDGKRVLVVGNTPPALYVIDADPTSSFFNTIPNPAIALTAAPLGIAVVPAGNRALITYAGRVAAIDATPTSGFGLEARDWTQTGVTFLGDVSVSADGAEAYAATGGGQVAVLGLGSGEGIVNLLAGGLTPREAAGAPAANAFFAVDENGIVRRYAKRGPLSGSLAVGGGFRGLAMSPEGSYAYAGNFVLNRVDVIDAMPATPTLATSFDTGVDPVDLAVGKGGRYLLVATDSQNRLEVYDTESSLVIDTVFPVSGPAGTLVTLAGSGFDPSPVGNDVSFAGTQTNPLSVAPDGSSMVVRVPDGAASGPVLVTAGGTSSNARNFSVVHRTDPGQFVRVGTLDETAFTPMNRMVSTADGRWIFGIRGDGSMAAIQADPSRPSFMRIVQNLTPAQTGLSIDGVMAVTPNGKKLYVNVPGTGAVAIFSISTDPASPLARAGTVQALAGGDASLSADELVVTPDGGRLLGSSSEYNRVFEVSTATDEVLTNTNSEAIGGFGGGPSSIGVDPRGNRLYVGDYSASQPVVRVVDLDPASGTYRQFLATYPLSPAETQPPSVLIASPDGSRLYSLVSHPLALDVQYDVDVLDIDPASPTLGSIVGNYPVDLDVQPLLRLNNSGTVLFVLDKGAPGVLVAHDPSTGSVMKNGPASGRIAGSLALLISPDDARLYLNDAGGGTFAVDVTSMNGMVDFSGNNQTGVVSQPLPAPFVVQVTHDATPEEGSLVIMAPLPPTTGNFGAADGNVYLATDAAGMASAVYTLGDSPGTGLVAAAGAAASAQFVCVAVGDTSAAPPAIVSVVPASTQNPGVNTNIAVDFSKAVVPSTVTAASFVLHPSGGTALPGTFTFANGQKRAVFDPTGSLLYNTTYQIDLTAAIHDNSGNSLSNPGSFTFTTSAPPPLRLSAIQSSAARKGDTVVLSGTGFDPNPALNTVHFTGADAVPVAGDAGALTVAVPNGAGTGPVTVAVGGAASNPLAFTLLAAVTAPVNQTLATITVPSSGQSIAILPNGTRSYMTSPGANTVVPITLPDGAVLPAIPVGINPWGVAPSPSSDRVFVSNFFSNSLSVIDAVASHPTYHRVIATIPTGANPTGIAVNPDGRTVYVACYGDNLVEFIDADSTSGSYNSAKGSAITEAGSKSVAVSPDGATLVVGTGVGVLLFDAADGSAKGSAITESGSKSVAVTPDGAYAVVLTEDDHLFLIDIRDGVPDEDRAKGSAITESGSKSVAVSPDGAFAYVTTDADHVLVFQIVTLGAAAATPADQASPGFGFVLVSTIPVGENPDGLAFDRTTGLLVVVNSGNKTVTLINASATPVGPVAATADVDPNTLNVKSNGKYVSAYLQFPTYLDPHDVDVSTVLLNGEIHAIAGLETYGDKNGDGILEIQVKFPRGDVQNLLPQGDAVAVHITGRIDGRDFTADDAIRVKHPDPVYPQAGAVLGRNTASVIRWVPMHDDPADHLEIYFTADGGSSWSTVTDSTADDSTYAWTVPDLASTTCLMMIVARDGNDGVLGIGITGAFSVGEATVGVDEALPARFALLPAAPNPFAASTNLRFDLAEPARVTLRVFALDGSLVRVLADGVEYPAGHHAVVWDGRDGRGSSTAAGVYFVRIQAGADHGVKKIVRAR